MSSYLTFKKGNAVLSSHSRNTLISIAFDNVVKFTDEWQPLTSAAITKAVNNLEKDIADAEKNMRLHKNLSECRLSYEDLFGEMRIIQDLEEQIEEYKEAIAQLRLYLSIANNGDLDGDVKQPLMYAYL